MAGPDTVFRMITIIMDHEVHIHGRYFGNGAHSTSHIELFWGQLKSIIKKIILHL